MPRLVGLILAAAAPVASAGSFQLSPIYGEVAPGQSVITYTLSNPGDTPVTLQVEGRTWLPAEKGAVEVRAGHPDLVIAPRILTIQPGERRPVRVALRGERTRERAYRIVVQELPPPPPPGFVGMRAVIAQDVPLIFTVDGKPGDPSWRIRMPDGNELVATSSNPGSRFLRITNMALVDERGALLAKREGGAYLLAGQEQDWPLTRLARLETGQVVRIRYEVDGTFHEFPVTVR